MAEPEKKGVKKAGAKKAATKKKAATSSKRAAKAPAHDEIAKRAYEIHEREGGNHEENWLRAERELRGG
jgi:hypothetical protein